MNEDAMLDSYMEDRLSGGGGYGFQSYDDEETYGPGMNCQNCGEYDCNGLDCDDSDEPPIEDDEIIVTCGNCHQRASGLECYDLNDRMFWECYACHAAHQQEAVGTLALACPGTDDLPF